MLCFCHRRNTEVKIFHVRDLTYSKGLLRTTDSETLTCLLLNQCSCYNCALIKADLGTCSVWSHCVSALWWIKGCRLKNQLHSMKCLFLHYCNYWPFTRIKGVLHYFHTYIGLPLWVPHANLAKFRGWSNHTHTFHGLCLKISTIHQLIGNRYCKEIWSKLHLKLNSRHIYKWHMSN